LKLDMSDVVRRTIQQWDGIPFYASNEHREVSS
jgi:hypothetical protein